MMKPCLLKKLLSAIVLATIAIQLKPSGIEEERAAQVQFERDKDACLKANGSVYITPSSDGSQKVTCLKGPYAKSCVDCREDDGVLTCYCPKRKKYDPRKVKYVTHWMHSDIRYDRCKNHEIKNNNGHLECEE